MFLLKRKARKTSVMESMHRKLTGFQYESFFKSTQAQRFFNKF